MKWFKHHSDLSRKRDIAAYMKLCGRKNLHHGYGLMHLLFEIIAEGMDKDNPEPSASFALSQWAHLLHCHHHAVPSFFGKLEEAGLVTVSKREGNWEVVVPKMSKLADEYMRKSGHRPDKVAQTRTDKTRKEESGGTPSILPNGFAMSEEMRLVAVRNCPTVDADHCFSKFIAHCRSTNKKYSDWNAAWEAWTLRENEVPPYKNKDGAGESKQERWRNGLLELSKLLRIIRRPGESESSYIERLDIANQKRLDALDTQN